MASKRNLWLRIMVSAAAIVLLASCDTLTVYRGRGQGYSPPIHAKAHGCRRKVVHGYELAYDSGSGLYVVVDMAGCYYHEGYFYRFHDDVWEISLRATDWGPVHYEKLPTGLRIKTRSIARVTGNSNGIVKLNGNGHSLAKLNGNGRGKH